MAVFHAFRLGRAGSSADFRNSSARVVSRRDYRAAALKALLAMIVLPVATLLLDGGLDRTRTHAPLVGRRLSHQRVWALAGLLGGWLIAQHSLIVVGPVGPKFS